MDKEKGKQEFETHAYAAYIKDAYIREASSSGGIFSELANLVLNQNGLIYGAAYDKKFMVKHIYIDNSEDLQKLRGAKYVQSSLGNCYQDIKKQLESGREVLFAGTPCQVVGLKSFLGKDYAHLICIDFVCHGVPLPAVWEKYIQYRMKIDQQEVFPVYINMRSKETGWSRYAYSVEFRYADGRRYISKNSDDLFMKLFVNNYILCKACGNCRFKGYERVSDITLGDFWGIWDIVPEMDDDKGTSLVLTHSQKGECLFDMLDKNIHFKHVTLEQASRMNPSLIKTSIHHAEREKILNVINQDSFEDVISLIAKERKGNGFKGSLKMIFNKIWRNK